MAWGRLRLALLAVAGAVVLLNLVLSHGLWRLSPKEGRCSQASDLVWCPGSDHDGKIAPPEGNVFSGRLGPVSRGKVTEGQPHICISFILIPGKSGEAAICDESSLAYWANYRLTVMYAERHGYDLYTTTECLREGCKRPPFWNNIIATLMLLERCEYVMWIDADAVIMNMSAKIEDLIATAPQANVILSGDTNVVNAAQIIWKRGAVAERFLQEAFDVGEFGYAMGGDNAAISAILGGCSAKSTVLELKACYDRVDVGFTNPWVAARIREANSRVIELLVDEHWLSSVSWVPQRAMNSYQETYRDGDFILHVVGYQGKLGKGPNLLAAVTRSESLNGICFDSRGVIKSLGP